jgi:predicted enzyme related to lactoylglutathione lyase
MGISAKFAHTNLIAENWQRLSQFYQGVFNCVPVPPERHLRGHDLERGTGVAGSEVHGVHLRLPGYGEEGPTLEIFSYTVVASGQRPAINRPGFAHIAFAVSNVVEAQETVIQAGGSKVGDVVTLQLSTGAKVTWCYVRDPEGNIIELQSWG